MELEKRTNVVLFISASIFSVVIGFALVDLSQEFTIGRLAKKIGLPAIAFCILLVVFSNTKKLFRVRDIFHFESFSPKIIPLLIIPGIILGTIISRYGHLGLTYAMTVIVCLTGLLCSFIFTISRRDISGIAILLLIYPLILFLQHQFRYFLWDDPYEIIKINILKPSEIVWIITFLLIIIHKFINKEKLEIFKIQKYFIILGFLLVISAIFSSVPLTSLKFPYRDILLPIIFLTIFLEMIKTLDDFKNLFKIFTFSMILELAVVSYFFLLAGGEKEHELFRSDLAISAAGIVGFFGVIAFQVVAACSSFFSCEKKKFMKLIYFFVILMALLIVLTSRARAFQIAVLITSPILLIRKKNLSIYFFMALLLATVLLFIPDIREIAFERFSPWFHGSNIYAAIMEKEEFSRNIYITSINMFMDYPVWGIGWGMWDELIHNYWSHPIVPNSPHSAPLFYFVTAGTAAGIVFILLWFYIIIKSIRLLITHRKSDVAFLIIGLVWIITANTIGQLVRGGLIFAGYSYTFIPVCLLFALDKVLSKEKKSLAHKIE